MFFNLWPWQKTSLKKDFGIDLNDAKSVREFRTEMLYDLNLSAEWLARSLGQPMYV